MAPYIVKELENNDIYSAYTHITKGSMSIKYFIEDEAATYFKQKVTDFFSDSKARFPNDDLSEKVLVWLQGESDAKYGYELYLERLGILWENAKDMGFTKFFIARIDYFGSTEISEIMRAQEDFCLENENAFIITRVASYLEWDGAKKLSLTKTDPEFSACRDSFYGYRNNHINEKGFKIIAKYATPNIIRILFKGEDPILEEERVCDLL